MPIANYTTGVPVSRSMMEVQELLMRAGAKSVRIDYQDREPHALAFLLTIHDTDVPYQLPANAEGMLRAMKADRKVPRHFCNLDRARMVAWRTVKDWLRAQFALVEAEQATLAEVMLPYAVTASGRTLYRELEERGPALLALGSGNP